MPIIQHLTDILIKHQIYIKLKHYVIKLYTVSAWLGPEGGLPQHKTQVSITLHSRIQITIKWYVILMSVM